MRNWIAVLGIFIGTAGCVSTNKMIYMQDLQSDAVVLDSSELIPYDVEEYRLQINDVVDITIRTTSEELNELLQEDNGGNQMRNMDGLTSGDVFFMSGYTLNEEGIVDLPLIGELRIVGMDVNEAKRAVEKSLENYVIGGNYYVRVRLGGVRYGALGEFSEPGKYTILQNRITIFEAIANAGDMTSVADRSEVLIIRQYPEGSRTHKINLLSDKIMESEFFFVRPNDLIYAKPLKAKQWGTGVTFAQTFELTLTTLTFILLLLR